MAQSRYFLRSRHDLPQTHLPLGGVHLARERMEKNLSTTTPSREPPPEPEPEAETFPLCGKLFPHNCELKRHIQNHTDSLKNNTEPEENTGFSPRMFSIKTRESDDVTEYISETDDEDCDARPERPKTKSHFILKRLGITESLRPGRISSKPIPESNYGKDSLLLNIVGNKDDMFIPEGNRFECDLVTESFSSKSETCIIENYTDGQQQNRKEELVGSVVEAKANLDTVNVNNEGDGDSKLSQNTQRHLTSGGAYHISNVDASSMDQEHSGVEQVHLVYPNLESLPISASENDTNPNIGSSFLEKSVNTLQSTEDGLFRVPLPIPSPTVHHWQTPKIRYPGHISSPQPDKRQSSYGFRTPDQSPSRFPLSLNVPESPLYLLPRYTSELPRLNLTPNLGLGATASTLVETALRTPNITEQLSSPFLPAEVMSTPFLMRATENSDVPDLINMLDNEAGTMQAFEHRMSLYDLVELTDSDDADYVVNLAEPDPTSTVDDSNSPQRRLKVTQSFVKGRHGKRATGEMLEYLKAQQREKSRLQRKLRKENKPKTESLEDIIKQRISEGGGRKTRLMARVSENFNIQPTEVERMEEE